MSQRRFSTSIRRAFSDLIRSENGSAMLELAVAIPIVILLTIGVADYARLYYTSITVANAAQAGASLGAADPGATSDQMRAAAQTDAGSVALDTVSAGRYCFCPGSGPGSGVVACSATCDTYGVAQGYDTVRVRKDVSMLIPYPGLPATVPIIRTVVLRSN